MNPTVVSFIYLVAGILFILGIKGLTKPKTAVRGNKLSALGMLIAVVVTLLDGDVVNYNFIIAGVLVGSGIGAVMALKIQYDLDAADGCSPKWFRWGWPL